MKNSTRFGLMATSLGLITLGIVASTYPADIVSVIQTLALAICGFGTLALLVVAVFMKIEESD